MNQNFSLIDFGDPKRIEETISNIDGLLNCMSKVSNISSLSQKIEIMESKATHSLFTITANSITTANNNVELLKQVNYNLHNYKWQLEQCTKYAKTIISEDKDNTNSSDEPLEYKWKKNLDLKQQAAVRCANNIERALANVIPDSGHHKDILSSALDSVTSVFLGIGLWANRKVNKYDNDAYPDGEPKVVGYQEDENIEYKKYDSISLLKKDFNSNAVNQGSDGDCWYLATIGSLLVFERGRKLLYENIKRNNDSTYTVRLYDDFSNPKDINISSKLPTKGGQPIYASGSNKGANWVSIYEKAATQFYGDSYGDIYSGYDSKAISALTGQKSSKSSANFSNAKNKFFDGNAIVVSSKSKTSNTKVISNHAYYVKGFSNNEVILGNPWGKNYELSLSKYDFEQNFKYISSTKMN